VRVRHLVVLAQLGLELAIPVRVIDGRVVVLVDVMV